MTYEEFKLFALTYLEEKDQVVAKQNLEKYIKSLNKKSSSKFEEDNHNGWIEHTFTIHENDIFYDLIFLNIKEGVFYLNMTDEITNNKMLITIPIVYAVFADDDFAIEIEESDKNKNRQMPITISWTDMKEFNNDIKKYKDKAEFYSLTTDIIFPEIENILLKNKNLIDNLCLLGKYSENKNYTFKDFVVKTQQKIKYQH